MSTENVEKKEKPVLVFKTVPVGIRYNDSKFNYTKVRIEVFSNYSIIV